MACCSHKVQYHLRHRASKLDCQMKAQKCLGGVTDTRYYTFVQVKGIVHSRLYLHLTLTPWHFTKENITWGPASNRRGIEMVCSQKLVVYKSDDKELTSRPDIRSRATSLGRTTTTRSMPPIETHHDVIYVFDLSQAQLLRVTCWQTRS